MQSLSGAINSKKEIMAGSSKVIETLWNYRETTSFNKIWFKYEIKRACMRPSAVNKTKKCVLVEEFEEKIPLFGEKGVILQNRTIARCYELMC